jgi:hypothetical protein
MLDLRALLILVLVLVFSRSLSDIALKSDNGNDGGVSSTVDDSGIDGGSCGQAHRFQYSCMYVHPCTNARMPTSNTNSHT